MLYSNAVCYPNSSIQEGRTPAILNYEHISHVYYTYAKVAADGAVYFSNPEVDCQRLVDGSEGALRACTALRQYNQRLKIILSIGGPSLEASQIFAMVAGDRSKRIRCAYTARQLVNTYDLDGIDIHWENLIEQHICNSYLQLLAEMRAYLPPSHYLLTSALSADPWTLRNLDLQTASMFLDLINLRSYDFAGPWTRAAGHASQIYMPPVTTYANEHCMTVLSALRHYIEESKVPPSKILLGIPVFGRSFLGATRAGDSYLADGGVFPYSGLPRPHSIEEYDAQAQAAYCVGGDGGFVTYDNPSSVCHKAELVKNNRLAGLYFTDGTADHSGHRSIIQAGFLHLAPGD